MKNFVNNYNIFVYDSISKFNIYDKKKIVFINNLKIFVNLKSLDSFFLKNILFVSKLFFNLFHRKIYILKLEKDVNKLRNSLIFCIGISFNDNRNILKNLDYLFNVVKFVSKRGNDYFKLKKKEKNFLYFFKNINYFLGFDSSKITKTDINYNFLIILNNYKNLYFLNKKIIKFYEKLFL